MKIESKDMYKMKRIKIKGDKNEFIGILVGNNNMDDFLANSLYAYNYQILSIDGTKYKVKESQIQQISTVKNVDNDIREMLNQYGLKRKQIDKKLNKMKKEAVNLLDDKKKDEDELMKKVVAKRGLLFPEEFRSKLYKKIKEKTRNEYDLYTSGSYLDNLINIDISKRIEKYATPEKYSFIYEEYDRSLQIGYDTPSYKKFIKKYDNKFNILSAKGLKELGKEYGCIINQSSELSVGDKNWLSYNFCLCIQFDKKFILNEDYLNKVVSIISKFL